MYELKDKSGKVLREWRNLGPLRRYVRGYTSPPINSIGVRILPEGADHEGVLEVVFANGDRCDVPFGSLDVLKKFVRRWRYLYGRPFLINGEVRGHVAYKHFWLADPTWRTYP